MAEGGASQTDQAAYMTDRMGLSRNATAPAKHLPTQNSLYLIEVATAQERGGLPWTFGESTTSTSSKERIHLAQQLGRTLRSKNLATHDDHVGAQLREMGKHLQSNPAVNPRFYARKRLYFLRNRFLEELACPIRLARHVKDCITITKKVLILAHIGYGIKGNAGSDPMFPNSIEPTPDVLPRFDVHK